MAGDYPRPVRRPGEVFDGFQGGEDPATLSRVAHESAQALLSRARRDQTPEVLDRLLGFVDENGINALAELWSNADARSLPGTLWRIYLIQSLIRQSPEEISLLYRQGVALLPGIHPVVAGAAEPTGPDEVRTLADQIFHGVFRGDFAVALERAASFCSVTAAGASDFADAADLADPDRGTQLTTKALRLSQLAEDLLANARMWRLDGLD